MTKKLLKLINKYNKHKSTRTIFYIKTYPWGSGSVYDNNEIDSFMFDFEDTKDLEDKLNNFYCD